MQKIPRERLRAPAKVIDLDLSELGSAEIAIERYRSLWCLSRLGGTPVDVSFWNLEGEASISPIALGDRVRATSSIDPRNSVERDLGHFGLTVVICTRERPDQLQRALMSLTRQDDGDFDVLVVDNDPQTESTEKVVEQSGLPRCSYMIERNKGLSRARNAALSRIQTEYVAWIDDDELADVGWVRNIKSGFADPSRPAAVCGVMLPAELETEAQVRFEQYGGFNKGRSLFSEILSEHSPSVISPLYPLPAIGSGGNMAFQVSALLSAGGFDECLGAGTSTHGGEDTKVFATLLRSKGVVLHWPRAITWHFHRREMKSLHKQFFGYGAGLTAFYASMFRSNPSVAFQLFRLAPHALRDLRTGSGGLRTHQLPTDFPTTLLRASQRGLAAGAFNYTYEALRARIQDSHGK